MPSLWQRIKKDGEEGFLEGVSFLAEEAVGDEEFEGGFVAASGPGAPGGALLTRRELGGERGEGIIDGAQSRLVVQNLEHLVERPAGGPVGGHGEGGLDRVWREAEIAVGCGQEAVEIEAEPVGGRGGGVGGVGAGGGRRGGTAKQDREECGERSHDVQFDTSRAGTFVNDL